MAASYEPWEAHRYLKNRLGIVPARGGGLLDHPYAHVTHHLLLLRKIIWQTTSHTTVVRRVIVIYIFYFSISLIDLNLNLDLDLDLDLDLNLDLELELRQTDRQTDRQTEEKIPVGFVETDTHVGQHLGLALPQEECGLVVIVPGEVHRPTHLPSVHLEGADEAGDEVARLDGIVAIRPPRAPSQF